MDELLIVLLLIILLTIPTLFISGLVLIIRNENEKKRKLGIKLVVISTIIVVVGIDFCNS